MLFKYLRFSISESIGDMAGFFSVIFNEDLDEAIGECSRVVGKDRLSLADLLSYNCDRRLFIIRLKKKPVNSTILFIVFIYL